MITSVIYRFSAITNARIVPKIILTKKEISGAIAFYLCLHNAEAKAKLTDIRNRIIKIEMICSSFQLLSVLKEHLKTITFVKMSFHECILQILAHED